MKSSLREKHNRSSSPTSGHTPQHNMHGSLGHGTIVPPVEYMIGDPPSVRPCELRHDPNPQSLYNLVTAARYNFVEITTGEWFELDPTLF